MEQELAGRWIEHMRRGDFAGAWEVSDRILSLRPPAATLSRPRHEQAVWGGEPLDGRRVLVRCYHGLGDTLQFVRFMPRLRAIAGSTVLWAQPRLIPLLRHAPGVDEVATLSEGSPPVEYEADIEIMELPHALRCTLDDLPAEVPYLHAPPAPLPVDHRLRVGLVWHAGDWDSRRNLVPGLLAPLLAIPGIRWFVLQEEPEPRIPGTEHLDVDVYGMATVMRSLDLMISADSMPAHLAGALGVPVWTLLHAEPDWRWMEGRLDSPWYPTMRLFRQPSPGAWGAVVAEVRKALLEELASREEADQPSRPATRRASSS